MNLLIDCDVNTRRGEVGLSLVLLLVHKYRCATGAEITVTPHWWKFGQVIKNKFFDTRHGGIGMTGILESKVRALEKVFGNVFKAS